MYAFRKLILSDFNEIYNLESYLSVIGINGRSERTRSFDPLVPNQVRYQAALHSDNHYSYEKWTELYYVFTLLSRANLTNYENLLNLI